ncbi:MAG: HK97-gp10 family putative phage morphogenesis protein [bacterium]
MANKSRVKIRWFKNSYFNGLKPEIGDELNKGSKKIQRKMKSRCPVDTGKLKDSISVGKNNNLEYRVGTNLDYAKFVEFGTSTSSSQPFMRPSVK